MTKLGAIEFDDRILDALRDDKLVVFAGAGVSMGPPSDLPSFWKLAEDIAEGTNLKPENPLDRFLGQLHDREVKVHERAIQFLSPADSAPKSLHLDLLRLFRTAARVRLVTTNFDLHFETASSALFGLTPDVYRAPALPLGYDFTGIVHVHGALPDARHLVLTDADFGRAYLTEGWARRFLLDVFRHFTVLFVGYSHSDVVMQYLARALPPESVARRFALTDEDGRWDQFGIKPIRFTKGAYGELDDGVKRLAEWVTRGELDWQKRMAEIGWRNPPADEEAISEVEHALREVHTTRFLTSAARDPEWVRWLNARQHLDALFGSVDLTERDKVLAEWMAKHFAIVHADTLFELIASHGLRLNPLFWHLISHELAYSDKDIPLGECALKRWVSILLTSAPAQANYHVLMWLAERSTSYNAVPLTVKVFLKMSEHSLRITPEFSGHDEEVHASSKRLHAECPLGADHRSLDEVWTKHIKPHLSSVAPLLLSGITRRLEDIHGELTVWGKASRERDPVSYGRSAIEQHDQDRYPEAVDILIDAARDALEWIATDSPALLEAWVETLVTSNVPLLRRLAVHAITVHPSRSADDRLNWLLARVGLHDVAEHHEVHRAVAFNYAAASDLTRQALVNAILANQCPASDVCSAEERTARSHFDWLSWLLRAMPDCVAAETALAPIRAAYPDWRPSEHPDLTHYWLSSTGWVGSQSPWSIEQLLARMPREQLDDLLSFKRERFGGPDREGLSANVRQACKHNVAWGRDMAEALNERRLWSADLWPAVIQGMQDAELSLDDWRALLSIAGKAELLMAHAHDVAHLLHALVKNGGKPFALELLDQANAIAHSLWQALPPDPPEDETDDWLLRAINHPAGVIVQFRISSLSLLMRGRSGAERALPEEYRQWFTMVVQDTTLKGVLGRSVLASQTAFLFGLDEEWTRQHLLPSFREPDRHKFAQAWHGFLVWGRLNAGLADALMPAFEEALKRVSTNRTDHRDRFINFYTALAVLHVADPTKQLLPDLFHHGSMEDRTSFASSLGEFLRQMEPASKKQMWDAWLCRYWKNRLDGVPAPLLEAEIEKMLEWLPHLDELFPAACLLVARGPEVKIAHSDLLFELRDSDLITRYPTESAELLIYLCHCIVGYHAADVKAVATRLPALAPNLRLHLDESLARLG